MQLIVNIWLQKRTRFNDQWKNDRPEQCHPELVEGLPKGPEPVMKQSSH